MDSTKNCRHRGGGVKNPGKLPTSFMDDSFSKNKFNFGLCMHVVTASKGTNYLEK